MKNRQRTTDQLQLKTDNGQLTTGQFKRSSVPSAPPPWFHLAGLQLSLWNLELTFRLIGCQLSVFHLNMPGTNRGYTPAVAARLTPPTNRLSRRTRPHEMGPATNWSGVTVKDWRARMKLWRIPTSMFT